MMTELPFPFSGEPRLGVVHRALTAALSSAGIETAPLDSRLLLQQALGICQNEFIKRPERLLTRDELARLAAVASRRLDREPISRIRGEAEFWSLPFSLSASTLDPRPDTETLVEAALRLVASRRDEPIRILDLGTGSGCILLSLLSELPMAEGLGVDVSEEAVETARVNAARLDLTERAAFIVSDWFDKVAGRYDLIVSNPPYIPSAEIDGLSREVAVYEPRRALDGGVSGVEPYHVIFQQAAGFLKPGWAMVIEFGAGQHNLVQEAITAAPLYGEVSRLDFHKDLGGIIRAISIESDSAAETGRSPRSIS